MLDLERIVVRTACERATPRDVAGLKSSMEKLKNLSEFLASGENSKLLNSLRVKISDFTELQALLNLALANEIPVGSELTGAIRSGYNSDLDNTRNAAKEGRAWLSALESRRKEATQIPTLKIGYTSVFGYYYEVTKAHASKSSAGMAPQANTGQR